ncbi:VOC family protein [Mycoplasma sp. P36-A1]|uniref:VOC family protein n=1 Tax=Mycoplasma sp. P36-A1 TaxID=3252900 RepID=UPI003C2B8793
MQKPICFISTAEHVKQQMELYESILPNTKITQIEYYPDFPDRVLNGQMDINGLTVYFLEMGAENPVTIGWNINLYCKMNSVEEFDRIFEELSKGGTIMMGPQAIENFIKVVWFTDIYGLTWQFSVE